MLIGIIFVIIFISILILVHEVGHFLAAKKFGLLVEEFGFGLPPKLIGKKIGETVYSLNAFPFGGFVKIYGEDSRDWSDELRERNFAFLKVWRRAVIVAAGVLMNFLLGWLVISIVFLIGIPSLVLITEVKSGSPAAEIGLLAGDKIIELSAGSEKIGGEELNVKNVVDFVNDYKGREINLKIGRNGETLNLKAVPRTDAPAGEGALGVALADAGLPRQGVLTSFWEGLKTSLDMAKTIALAIFGLVAKAFVGKASFESVAGPVGIVKVTAQAGSLGFVYLLQLLALISINLAVINIMPFPALDGGRLVFLLIEKIKGSPVNPKFEKIVNAAGFALLIFLMLAITVKDIIKL